MSYVCTCKFAHLRVDEHLHAVFTVVDISHSLALQRRDHCLIGEKEKAAEWILGLGVVDSVTPPCLLFFSSLFLSPSVIVLFYCTFEELN